MRRFNPDKELRKIQRGNKNKIILFVISLLVVGIIGYSFALYQVRYSKRIIYTKVAPFSNKDIQLAVYLDGSPSTSDFPKKNSGYRYDKIECDNGSTAKFDNTKWKVVLEAGNKDKCNVYFVKEEGIPNVPELYQGLIPIVYDESGNISVADTTTDWYNYDDKRWANAVLVDSSNYSKYVKNGEYINNKAIPMTEILQMYVWIPRYKYQLFNVDNGSIDPMEIQIQFENNTETTGEVTCSVDDKGKETCENATNGNWYTHPAFKFGNTDLTGIWFGKFEPSGSETLIKIIPNVTPLRALTLSRMFLATRNIDLEYSQNYNLNNNKIDTHVIKNIEWGVMAYLTHSKYGRCTNGNCTNISPNVTTYTTGYASQAWNTANGILASTTGNIYGIYDANGGALEYAMANMVDKEGKFYSSRAEFVTAPDEKYYDKYENDESITTHARGHLGDATRETLQYFGNERGGWYSGYSHFPYSDRAWFMRSGRSGGSNDIGPFYSWDDWGNAYANTSFRVVLTAQDGTD